MRLNTRSMLWRKHLLLEDVSFVNCDGSEVETSSHLFFFCPHGLFGWRIVFLALWLPWREFLTAFTWIEVADFLTRRKWNIFCTLVQSWLHVIWRLRCLTSFASDPVEELTTWQDLLCLGQVRAPSSIQSDFYCILGDCREEDKQSYTNLVSRQLN